MTIRAWRGLIVPAVALACSTVISPACAQYPSRAVRLIVPFPAGSGNDTVARFVQPQLSAALGQQLVIDNRAGAAGNLGAEVAAKSAPDGYTLMMGNIAHAISMTLYPKLGYDIVRDFAPVTMLASGSFCLTVHPSVPAKSTREFITFAKRRPGQLNVATAGAAIQLAAKLLDSMSGTRMTEINYKGTPQAITGLISGEASVGFPATSSVLPQTRAGKLRAIAVTTPQRSSIAPDIPTIAESGVPGYDVTSWYGLMAPAGTSKEVIARLHSAVATALGQPEVKERFAATDLEPASSAPEQFGAFVRNEVAKWGKLIKETGMKSE